MKDNPSLLKSSMVRVLCNRLTSRVYPIRIPLPAPSTKGWKPYPIFRGSTADVQDFSCHISVLSHDHCPHPPHKHKEEELLLLLAGEVDLILHCNQGPQTVQRKRLQPGQCVYYPAFFAHTLQTVSEDPANYLMFKWHSDPKDTTSPLGFSHYSVLAGEKHCEVAEGFSHELIFERPTSCLLKLQAHVSMLTPGAGYAPHVDHYDVAIIVLEGEVETLGERVGSCGVIFYHSGQPHGMRNPGEVTAKYVVFEFHGRKISLGEAFSRRLLTTLAKLKDPECWKRALKDQLERLR